MQVFVHSKNFCHKNKQFPTKKSFISGKDLNAHLDFPMKIKHGFWISPLIMDKDGNETTPWIEFAKETYNKIVRGEYKRRMFSSDYTEEVYDWFTTPRQKYILSDTARIYQFKTLEDYEKCVEKYPYYSNDTYLYNKNDPTGRSYNQLKSIIRYIKMLLDKLHTKMLQDGYTETDLNNIVPRHYGPYIFHKHKYAQDYSDIKVNVTVFDNWKVYNDIVRIKKKVSKYTDKRAYAQLKYHYNNSTYYLNEIYDILNKHNQLKVCSIDYNAMRNDGWDGFYIHPQAIKEDSDMVSKLKEENKKMGIYGVLNWWDVESMCVWNWCFRST